jgi:DNA invertase Pin-like site-specific DNA recombinase
MLLDGYIRVSRVGGREGERFISPAAQREQIEAWIRARGANVGEVFEELDQSGARGDRPLLIEAIARVEAGESAGIVVAKLDRFGRSLIDGLRAIQQIEAAGGIIVSVQDGLDPSTATGRLILQLLFSIAEWELERVRANWEEAKARAIERGVYVGREPFGYRRDTAGRLLIDPQQGPIVREIFARRAGGESFQEIARALNRQGLLTDGGAPFGFTSIWRIVRNPAYRGEGRHGSLRNPHAHPPLVEATLWQRCQPQPRAFKKQTELLLGGMIRCAGLRADDGRQGAQQRAAGAPSRLQVRQRLWRLPGAGLRTER